MVERKVAMDENDNAEIIERLGTIFRDVEDITEPSSMDKVLMVLDEIRNADEGYMELLVLKLKGETVTWAQPWYQDTKCLTRKPEIKEEAEKYETGPFTEDESRRFRKNWRMFVRKFDVPDTPIRLARWKNRDKSRNVKITPEELVRSFITAYLARGLQRSLYQVNRHFLQTYGYPVKLRSYTATEEKVMEICFYHKPKNAVPILSSVLGREPRGIYNKLNQYYNGEKEKKRVKWTLKLATIFLNQLMFHSGCSLEKLKNKQLDQSVWVKVGEEMEHQYKYLQAFWYGKLHVQLFVQCDVDRKTLRKILCKKLQRTQYKMWTDIRWKDLVLAFPSGFTHTFLHNTARSVFAKHPNYLTSPLMEVIEYITTHRFVKGKRLKCLQLNEEGYLFYVKHETKLKDLMDRP